MTPASSDPWAVDSDSAGGAESLIVWVARQLLIARLVDQHLLLEHTPATHRHDPRKVAAVGNQRRTPPTRPRTSSDAIGGHYRNVRASDAAMNEIRDAFESEVVPSSRSISIAAPIEPARRLRGTATAAQVIATLSVWLKSPDSSASCVMETRRQARRLPLRRTGSCVAATPSTAWRDST